MDENGNVEALGDVATNSITVGGSSTFTANALQTTGANVNVSAAAPPLAAYRLEATSATTTAWCPSMAFIDAAALATSGADVVVSTAAPPVADEALVASSAVAAQWDPLSAKAWGSLFQFGTLDPYVFLKAEGAGVGNSQQWVGATDAGDDGTLVTANMAGSLTVNASGGGTYFIRSAMASRSTTGSWNCGVFIFLNGFRSFRLVGGARVHNNPPQNWVASGTAALVPGDVITLRIVPSFITHTSETLQVQNVSLLMWRVAP